LVVLAVVAVALATAHRTPASRSATSPVAWIAANHGTIEGLNRDLTAIHAAEANPARWLQDWHRFHDDAEAAATLSNPGGQATGYWREMLNDYVNGSADLIQAEQAHNQTELTQAEQVLAAGDSAAQSFNQAMGLG
jgi:hypothetical protein